MRLRAPFTIAALLASTSLASAAVNIAIDLTHQRMHVDGAEGSYDWPISSARFGFSTPGGSFAPTHLEAMHYSRKYHMSPMPHAIFFRGGYAIHGTTSTGALGRPASHGCVRLSPGNATTLYDMVQREGARISISGSPPASRSLVEARDQRRRFTTDAPQYDEAYDPYGGEMEPRAGRRSRRYSYSYSYGYPQQPQYYGYSYGMGSDQLLYGPSF